MLTSESFHKKNVLNQFSRLTILLLFVVWVGSYSQIYALMSATKAISPIAAIAQLRSTSSKIQNLFNIAKCAHLARDQGACMLFLPECFGFIGESAKHTLEQAEALPSNDCMGEFVNSGEVADFLKSAVAGKNEVISILKPTEPIFLLDGLQIIAKESGLWISGGGMHTSGAASDPNTGNDRVHNTHVVVDNQGTLKAQYHKIHLFDVCIPGKVNLRESATTAPGKKLIVCDSPIGKLGLATCYDMRFPEMSTRLVQAGAEVLLFPSAFTVPTGAAHWHTLLKARAIENQCYVIAAAQFGRHNAKRESFGHSLGINPWGKILADAGGFPMADEEAKLFPNLEDPPSIVTCEIDLKAVDSTRERMPIAIHRANADFSL